MAAGVMIYDIGFDVDRKTDPARSANYLIELETIFELETQTTFATRNQALMGECHDGRSSRYHGDHAS